MVSVYNMQTKDPKFESQLRRFPNVLSNLITTELQNQSTIQILFCRENSHILAHMKHYLSKSPMFLSPDMKLKVKFRRDEFCTDVAFFSFFSSSCALPRLDGIPVTQEDHRQDTKLLLLQIPQHPEI